MTKLTYFKRYRMELDLRHLSERPTLPRGYSWVPWHDSLLDEHAAVLHLSFHNDLDSLVFPSFGHVVGCGELMRVIRSRAGFCPAATWLIAHDMASADHRFGRFIGTVQGIMTERGCGAIQNLGVIPEYRGKGLGRALLNRALHGFVQVGAARAMLEVTARNEAAIRMYRSVGFRSRKTLYKGVEVPEPAGAGAGV